MPTAYPVRQLVHWQAVRITAKCRTYRMHYLLTHLMHLLFQLGLLHCRSVVDTGHAMHQLRHALHSLAHPLSLLRSEVAARHWYGHTARLQGHALHHVGHLLVVLAHAGSSRTHGCRGKHAQTKNRRRHRNCRYLAHVDAPLITSLVLRQSPNRLTGLSCFEL